MSNPDSKSTGKRRHRRVTPELAQKWFDLHDKGATVAHIARDEGRDLRTVRDAINSVTADVERSMVRREAMKEALKEHFRSLIDEVETLASRAASTRVPRIENLWAGDQDLLRLDPYDFVISGSQPTARYEAEGSVRWDMLTSHLKGHLLLRRFGEWRKAVQELVAAVYKTKTELLSTLEDISDAPLGNEAGRRLDVAGVRLIHEAVVNQAFGRRPDLEEVIQAVNTGNNAVRVSSHLMFAGVDDPEGVAARTLDWLKGDSLDRRVRDLAGIAEAVIESGSRLSREAQYVSAVPFPGGDCRACRRLGY